MDVALGRFNTNFDWDNGPIYINHAGDEKVEQFIPTSDGGALAVGYITYPMNGGNSIFLMKIGPNDEATQVTGNEPMNPLVGVVSYEPVVFKLYPNPMQEQLTVEHEQDKEVLIVFNEQGKMLFKEELLKGKTNVDIGFLNTGVYFIQLGRYTWKFIKP
jgi:hypothetical protein